MPSEKTRRWWPAIVHGFAYSLPFLLITRSPWALLVIGGTHAVLDHYRVAKYVIWAKNLIGPREYQASLKEALANCGLRELERQRIANLVQSTDQAWHWLWLFAAALITA
jgi:hypothetical protein